MSTATEAMDDSRTLTPSETAVSDDLGEYQYLELSWTAIASLAAGLLALFSIPLAFISNPEPSSVMMFGILPALSFGSAVRAIFQIRSRRDELTGERFAWVAMVCAVVAAASGWSAMGYVYATEVPPDHLRVSYDLLAPPGNAVAPGMFFEVPESAVELDGKQVFIKGYAYPGDQKTGIRQFILCRDNGDCCFGGTPKMSDMIFVRLKEPLAIDYNSRIHKLAGTFRVAAGTALHNLGGVVYHLDNAECR